MRRGRRKLRKLNGIDPHHRQHRHFDNIGNAMGAVVVLSITTANALDTYRQGDVRLANQSRSLVHNPIGSALGKLQ